MKSVVLQKLVALSLERKLHFVALLVTALGVFMPWVSGQWLASGAGHAYTGFGFFTGLLGTAVFLLAIAGLLLVIVPLTGGKPLVSVNREPLIQLILAAQAVVLILAALTVLTKTTLEFARMEVRFGIYVSLIGSLVAVLYSYLGLLGGKEPTGEEVTTTTDSIASPQPESVEFTDPPVPENPHEAAPPPPLAPEEHHFRP